MRTKQTLSRDPPTTAAAATANASPGDNSRASREGEGEDDNVMKNLFVFAQLPLLGENTQTHDG